MRLKCLPACPLAPGPDAARIPGTCARHPSADPVGSPVLTKGCDHPQGRRWWRGWSKYWYGQGESDCYSHMCKSCWLWVRGQSQASPPLRLVAWLLTLHACPYDMSPGHGIPLLCGNAWISRTQVVDRPRRSFPQGFGRVPDLGKATCKGFVRCPQAQGQRWWERHGYGHAWGVGKIRYMSCCMRYTPSAWVRKRRRRSTSTYLNLPSSSAKCHPYQALASIP